MTRCPSSEQLRCWLSDRLTGQDAAALEAHVEACAVCQQALEELTGAAAPRTVAERAGGEESGADFLRRLEQTPPTSASLPGCSDGGAAPAPPPLAENAAAVAGYEILEELGRGGMGVVYKARQVRLNRVVALKMVLAGAHAGPDRLARFRTEAEAAARLQHPHIVQIYEVGEQEGRPFLALEYVEGGSLAEKLAGTPQPPRDAAELVATLARAVQAAHEKGVIHRDLKPANVLLAEDGTPKLTDFGLAKQLDVNAGQTPSGAVLGTPGYMGPEQARGHTGAIGPPADVYGLGATLYECLTGRPPFKAATTLDTILQVLRDEPVPPRQLVPHVPRDLETVCLKCLQKEPVRRYANAAALAEDLRRFLRGEPVKARPVGSVGRAWRWCRRNPVVAGLLATVALSLLLGAGAATGLAVWALGERDRADREATEANDNARRAYERGYISDLRLAQRAWEDTQPDRLLELLEAQQPDNTGGIDLRGFEWYYWWRLAHSELLSLPGRLVCYSPVGDRLATVSDQTTVTIWDADMTGKTPGRLGRQLPSLPGVSQPVQSVCFSPDGKRLALVEGERFKPAKVSVRDARTGDEVVTLKGLTNGFSNVCFSPDGKCLAGGGDDTALGVEVRLWDARTGAPLRAISGHNGRVERVAFSPDGKLLASVGFIQHLLPSRPRQPDSAELILWEPRTGKEVRRQQVADLPIVALAFSPDSKQFASCESRSSVVTLWDVASGARLRALEGHQQAVGCVAFSPDGRRLLSGAADKTLKLWDVGTGQALATLKGHAAAVTSVAFGADGRRFASAGADGAVKVWEAAVSQEPRRLVQGSQVTAFAFGPPGEASPLWLASAGADKTIKLWDSDARVLRTLSGQRYPVSRLALSPDRGLIAAAGEGNSGPAGQQKFLVKFARLTGEVKVWDAGTGRERPLEEAELIPVDLAISPDGNRLLAAGEEPYNLVLRTPFRPPPLVRVWELATGKLQHQFPLPASSGGLCFSRQGTQLALVGTEGMIHLWDTDTRKETLKLPGHDPYARLAFSPDGQRLACSAGERITVWDLSMSTEGRQAGSTEGRQAGGRQLLTLKGHTGPVTCIVFHPGGRRLASAAEDGTVRIWEAKTGQELLSLGGHRGPPARYANAGPQGGWFQLAFSPDGHHLAEADMDGTIRLWDARPPDHP
jgi:WD40 repeat protein/tRNA A-37 threonylcarbamoyl transferase component Bud32